MYQILISLFLLCEIIHRQWFADLFFKTKSQVIYFRFVILVTGLLFVIFNVFNHSQIDNLNFKIFNFIFFGIISYRIIFQSFKNTKK
jgi:hypothetical protein